MVGTPVGQGPVATTKCEVVESIIFVPHTPRGELVKRLQKAEDTFSRLQDVTRWKFVEKGGRKLIDILGNTNPWADEFFGRLDCKPCTTNPEGKGEGGCWV